MPQAMVEWAIDNSSEVNPMNDRNDGLATEAMSTLTPKADMRTVRRAPLEPASPPNNAGDAFALG